MVAESDCIWHFIYKNTYGKPDGSRLFEEERNGVWLEKLNEDGFTCVLPFCDKSLFYITFRVEDCKSQDLIEKIRIEKQSDTRLRDLPFISCYMLVHTDDANMASESVAVMDHILGISHTAWTVKEVDPMYMLGVQHVLTIERGIWRMEHKMPLYIDGMVKTWQEWLEIAGWGSTDPKTPAPSKGILTMHDPHMLVTPEESQVVLKRGYMNLAGGLVWPIKNCFDECHFAISNITTVMSKPSEEAWKYAMHVLAWLRAHKNRGKLFSSDGNREPIACVDASLDVDLHDGRVRAGHDIQMANGPVIVKCGKLQKVSFSIPGAEYMQLRNCAVDIIWLRQLLREIGLSAWISQPTEVMCDSSGAIDWCKFGKLTVGNKHIALAYHEVQQWYKEGECVPVKLGTKLNKSDIQTKPPTIQMTESFVQWLSGYARAPKEFTDTLMQQRKARDEQAKAEAQAVIPSKE